MHLLQNSPLDILFEKMIAYDPTPAFKKLHGSLLYFGGYIFQIPSEGS